MNRVILLGNLGKKAERRTTQTGKNVVSFSVGTSKIWKDSTGEKKENTQWHDVEHWNVSDKLFEYLNQGTKVLIEGELRYGEYEKNGVKHKTTKIVCNSLELANSGKSENKQYNSPSQAFSLPKMKDNVLDDDIPF